LSAGPQNLSVVEKISVIVKTLAHRGYFYQVEACVEKTTVVATAKIFLR
jgi:hypothetical protein